MLTLVLGGAGTGKTRLIYRQLREAMEAGCEEIADNCRLTSHRCGYRPD